MSGIIAYESAVTTLERAARKGFRDYERVPAGFYGTDVPGWKRCEEIRSMLELRDLHLLVSRESDRKKSLNTKYHVWSTGLPEGSLIQRSDGLLVSSPEFCLLQMANVLNDIQLARLVMQFCGKYSPDATSPDGFVSRPQITTVDGIAYYLESARRQQGVKRLRNILNWVADNAWSPREASLELLMVLPIQRGGYHFPKPELNVVLDDLPLEVQRILGKDICIVDIWWRQFLLGMEYLGRYRHDERFGVDLARVHALSTMGALVELVAAEQLGDATQMDMIARRAAKQAGRRVRTSNWPRLSACQALIDELISPLPTDPKRI